MVKTVFDSSREKADLPDKSDIKVRRNKDDGTSLKYQKIEEELVKKSLKKNQMRKDIM